MKKTQKSLLLTSGCVFAMFLLLICGVKWVDVQAIGPQNSTIGFAWINGPVHRFFAFRPAIYEITEILGLVALAVAGGFALLGLWQLWKRKSLKKVDPDIYLLAGLYVAVLVFYVFFELCVINYRPVMMDGQLEAAFPSSHTMLTVCIMASAMHQFLYRIPNKILSYAAAAGSALIAVATVVGRMVCGVHWFTDILGGLLLSAALLFAYLGVFEKIKR